MLEPRIKGETDSLELKSLFSQADTDGLHTIYFEESNIQHFQYEIEVR